MNISRTDFLLNLFKNNEGKVLSRVFIANEVPGWDENSAQSRTIDVHVKMLRQQGHEIHTVTGAGYLYGDMKQSKKAIASMAEEKAKPIAKDYAENNDWGIPEQVIEKIFIDGFVIAKSKGNL